MLQPEDVLGADLARTAHLSKPIAARLDPLNADDPAAAMEPVAANLDRTALAWLGHGEPLGRGPRRRMVALTVIVEPDPR